MSECAMCQKEAEESDMAYSTVGLVCQSCLPLLMQIEHNESKSSFNRRVRSALIYIGILVVINLILYANGSSYIIY